MSDAKKADTASADKPATEPEQPKRGESFAKRQAEVQKQQKKEGK